MGDGHPAETGLVAVKDNTVASDKANAAAAGLARMPILCLCEQSTRRHTYFMHTATCKHHISSADHL
jgi:hypothetical protein